MSPKPIVVREAAQWDVGEAVAFYLDEGADHAALRFIDALEKALDLIGRHPASGSPRYEKELTIPGLRCRQVPGFPHLIFYIEREDHVDVWRVLHGRRDIPTWMRTDGEDDPQQGRSD